MLKKAEDENLIIEREERKNLDLMGVTIQDNGTAVIDTF